MTDVIVIGRHYAITLGVVRSLGEAGYGVRLLALSNYADRIAGKSKYVRQVCRAEMNFEDILRGLEILRGSDDYILVVPLNDVTCMLLNQHEDQLKEHYDIPRIKDHPGEIESFMDKVTQKQIAQQCGLLTAHGRSYTTDESGIERAVNEVSFPCFQKPLASVKSKTGSKTCFAKCVNTEELQQAMRFARECECEVVLLEQFLPIDKELTAYGVAANGRVYIPACMEALRGGFHHLKGIAAEGIIISANSFGDTKEKLETYVKKTGLTGLFCIDLIQSNGQLYFTEMNMRAGGTCYAITLAGANLPGALADLVYDKSAQGPNDIQRDVHFLNEFIEFSAYMDRCISRKDYRLHMSGCQERLIKSVDDVKSWKAYHRLVVIKSTVLRLLGMR